MGGGPKSCGVVVFFALAVVALALAVPVRFAVARFGFAGALSVSLSSRPCGATRDRRFGCGTSTADRARP
ncbi:hypothetical protein CGL27_47215 [Streptomyces sp. 11-1-2]|nr:hypothetical protein CGL27_47215 [Streptomyces sp. 11-1-2]